RHWFFYASLSRLPQSCFFHCHAALRDLHSFPTRRSSDLSSPITTTLLSFSMAARRPRLMALPMVRFCTVDEAGTSTLGWVVADRSEEHTSELQSRENLVCRLLLEKKKNEQ